MKNENELFEKSNIPIIKSKFFKHDHKTFIKYTSNDNFKYIHELLNILCNNCKSKNKISLFHKSMKCLLKILYNLYNNEYFMGNDLLILTCFYIGLKLNEIRTKIPKIKKLKEIYPEKYNNYELNNIRQSELICIKLLDYNIDILTSYDCLIYLLINNNNNNLFDSAMNILESITKNNIFDFVSKPPLEIAEYCIYRAQRLNHYYIHPSLLIKEYNKNISEKNNISKNDDNNDSIHIVSRISKIKHSNTLSYDKLALTSTKTNNDKIIKNYNNQTNSIYNCSFKILKRLSNESSLNFKNMNSFSDLKNSINFNINKSIIGKKLYENNINFTTKKTNLLFKSAIFPKSNGNKEEKENFSNSNFLLFNRAKDINCNRNYYNKAKMIGQKKLFPD